LNHIVSILFLFTSYFGSCLLGDLPDRSDTFYSIINQQDTLKENQILYTGKVWTNKYRRMNGDPFLFVNYFLPGTVSINGTTFKNLLIRYDIYSDEIMIPVNSEEIVQLNREMIDSFSIIFENKVHRFIFIPDDTLNSLKDYKGYFNVLYNQKSALYIKHNCDISTNITEKSDGEFLRSFKVYFVKDKIAHPIVAKNDLYVVMTDKYLQIKKFIKDNKIKGSKNRPESYLPVIRFYDSLSQ
jgi:hypothetical protein